MNTRPEMWIFPALSFGGESAGIPAMASRVGQWRLENLIDFESEVASGVHASPQVRAEMLATIRNLDGAAARRAGFSVWLAGVQQSSNGAKFHSALAMAGGGLAVVMFLAGVSSVLGMVNHQIHGINLTLFLAILIGGQWLVLILAFLAWTLRTRASGGFSLIQTAFGSLVLRLAGNQNAPWWGRLMQEGGAARAAVLWRIARSVQSAGMSFNIGILCGLGAVVFTKDLQFYWETTTQTVMLETLERSCHFLSLPWSLGWPSAVPDADLIKISQWHPGQWARANQPTWWKFFLMTTLIWGMLPRLVLWCVSWWAEKRSLARLEFQARSHRVLWRELTGAERELTADLPLDGVLVLDVGGSGLTELSLRTFFLRRLRVHPTAWQSVAVLDEGAEAEASSALSKAPAGVILLAEGWSLSPARMTALHGKIRRQAGTQVSIKFVIANVGSDHSPLPPSLDERREWEKFVDSLRDSEAEVFCYEFAQDGA